jgi:hypothetical protein
VVEDEDKLRVPQVSLPPGAKEVQWPQVDIEDDRVLAIVLDDEETIKAKERIAEKRACLRRGG